LDDDDALGDEALVWLGGIGSRFTGGTILLQSTSIDEAPGSTGVDDWWRDDARVLGRNPTTSRRSELEYIQTMILNYIPGVGDFFGGFTCSEATSTFLLFAVSPSS
jgi:hypothetical protein